MAKDFTPKCKRCRRAGEKLFLKGERCDTPKCAMIRKPYVPGMHGKKKRRGLSEYGEQLAMKQKIKRTYGILEKQFKKYFMDVRNKPGAAGDLLLQKLEMRLDNVVFRAGFFVSRSQARQFIKHSHFLVNKKRVNLPSYEVRVGDVIEIKDGKRENSYFKRLKETVKGLKEGSGPNWLEVNYQNLTVKVKSRPTKDDIGISVNAQAVIEYYSR